MQWNFPNKRLLFIKISQCADIYRYQICQSIRMLNLQYKHFAITYCCGGYGCTRTNNISETSNQPIKKTNKEKSRSELRDWLTQWLSEGGGRGGPWNGGYPGGGGAPYPGAWLCHGGSGAGPATKQVMYKDKSSFKIFSVCLLLCIP